MGFGEKWIHEKVELPTIFRRILRQFRMSGTMVKGRGWTFLGFLGVPLGYVWGEPIKVKQQKPVDDKYLDEIHAKVVGSIEDIFCRYKRRFGYCEDEKLKIVSVDEAKKEAIGKSKKA